jgi:replication factor C small subunit
MQSHSLFVEKYRPSSLENYVGNENIKNIISKYIEQNDIQNLLLNGTAGTGKTTLAKLIVKNLDCDYEYINSSDERGIETIRDKVSGFASSASFKPLKVIILDEADFITLQAQASLRNIIEKFSSSTRFILTCNYVERIIDPIQSRCQTFNINPPSKVETARHLAKILSKEEIDYDINHLKQIITQYYPDIRKCINVIQSFTTSNKKLELDESILESSNYMSQVLKELTKSEPAKNKFKNIRQIIANANIQEYDDLYRYLYDNVKFYAPDQEGIITAQINEHLYQANFRIDKEINFMSFIANILNISK